MCIWRSENGIVVNLCSNSLTDGFGCLDALQKWIWLWKRLWTSRSGNKHIVYVGQSALHRKFSKALQFAQHVAHNPVQESTFNKWQWLQLDLSFYLRRPCCLNFLFVATRPPCPAQDHLPVLRKTTPRPNHTAFKLQPAFVNNTLFWLKKFNRQLDYNLINEIGCIEWLWHNWEDA